MKKTGTVKPLTLKRETIRALQTDVLGQVVAGGPPQTECPSLVGCTKCGETTEK